MPKFLIALLLGVSGFACADEALVAREDVRAYIAATARDYGFSEAELTDLFVRVEPKPSIIDIFDRPATSRPWYTFRANFVNPGATMEILEGIKAYMKRKGYHSIDQVRGSLKIKNEAQTSPVPAG